MPNSWEGSRDAQEPLGNLEQEAIPMAMATSFEPVKEFYNQIKNENDI